MAAAEEGFVAEMAIPLSEINTAADGSKLQEELEKFYLYITVSTEKGNAGDLDAASGKYNSDQCLFSPALGVVDDTVKHITQYWNAENNNKGYEILLKGQGGEEPVDTYEDDIKALVGEPTENAGFDVKLTADKETYKPGDEIKVVVELDKIKAQSGLNVFEFAVNYDKDKLDLKTDKTDFDGDGAYHPESNLEEKVINGEKVKFESENDWESLCSIDAENGIVSIKYTTTDAGSAAKDGDVKITLTFTAKADAEGKIGVWVANDEITASDYEFNDYYGNGTYVIVNPQQSDESDVGGESNTSGTTSPVQPGDYTTNMIVLAVIALVAVLGSAVVIKTRR